MPHPDTIVTVLLTLVIVLPLARLGASGATRLNQPAVMGELVFGILIGNLVLVGVHWFEPIKMSHTIEILSELGVILLLFQVGLESDLSEMMKVGLSSLLVAACGVIVPFGLGWLVGAWFFPDASVYMHVFLGAILTATSVGITARVLKDLGRTQTNEARIILGAAVLDDIMGLLILAIVSGIIIAAGGGQSMSSLAIMWLVAKAALFLV
ncbi:MAG: cation:proton antiporter, partial [candidate division Zixibacteria bacterium]|nr:cation:proton antiporter [candidate division Zixibacteria bacterium]